MFLRNFIPQQINNSRKEQNNMIISSFSDSLWNYCATYKAENFKIINGRS